MDYEKELLHEISKALERLDNSVDSINVTLAKQEVHLAEHIRRTELLEEEMKPVRDHVNRVNSLLLIIGGIFAVIAAVKGVIEIIQLFF